MKRKINYLLLLLVVILPFTVYAGASGSAPSSVENGSNVTFTVSVSNTAAWNLKLSGSGATSGCSAAYADVTANGNNTSKSFTVTCKATKEGTITFTATGDITSQDGANSNVSITKTTSVVKPREKETEARLSSLGVDGYDIGFNKDNTSYSIDVEPSVTSINISAKAMSGRASVSGAGAKEIDPAGSKFDITCTAENGATKTYTITVNVIDKNPIEVKIDNTEYTVVKTNRVLTAPSLTQESTTTINGIEVPSYKNEKANITIVGLKNKDGNIKYAIYDNNEYKVYNENKSSELLLFISEKELDGYKETKITINEVEYKAYEFNDRFKIVYAMNLSTGEYGFYKYDTKENTFQYFDTEKKEEKTTKKKNINVFLITTIVLAIIIIGLIVYLITTKKTKKSKKKKDKEEDAN